MGEELLPIDVIEAAISAIGKGFYFKAPVRAILLRAGFSPSWYDQHANEMKWTIARAAFNDLERHPDGRKIAISIVQQLCSITRPPDDKVDPKTAMNAFDELRRVSKAARIESARELIEREQRAQKQRNSIAETTARDNKVAELRKAFQDLFAPNTDPRQRGYALERLLKDLFHAHELEYTPSFKSETEQVDGAFQYASFHYLVETKWERHEATLASLDTFKAKVDRKLSSTRGLFLSIAGFADDVVRSFEANRARNIILISGEDLAIILEQRISLTDALDAKTREAAQKGRLFTPLREFL